MISRITHSSHTPLTHAPTSFQLQPMHQPQLHTQFDAKLRPPSQAKPTKLRRDSHWDRTPGSHQDRTDHTNRTDCTENAPQDHTEIAPITLFPNLVPSSSVDTNLFLTLSSFFSQFDRIWWIFFGWVLFLLYLFIEKWYYIFVWKLRKCEKQVENVFSILFSRTQPNTRKYFPKHFLECNQTLENIFLSWKYFHLKIFYTRKIFYIQPNTALEA